MKIGIDATSVWGLKDGLLNGMIAYTVHLVRNLVMSDDDNEYVVFCRQSVPNVFTAESKQARFTTLQSTNRKILQQWSLPRAVAQEGLDVMFYPYNSASLFSSVPSVVTIHDLHPFVIKERFERIHSIEQHGSTLMSRFNQLYWKGILRESCRRADKIIAVSATTKDDIVNVFGTSPERVHVVHEAVDGKRFNTCKDGKDRSEFLQSHNLPGRYVLAVGTHAYKNVEGIVDAFQLARSNGCDGLGLVIAGNTATLGSDVTDAIKESEYSKDIVLTGFFPDSDLKYLYQFAEMYLFPSFYEGFGLPILEAFSCGVPVITSDRGAMPEVAGEAAVLVNPEDHAEIARKIAEVSSDQNMRDELIQAGLKRAAQFTWERAADETREVLVRAAKTQ
jgi:glycosyltransferase involved in cell wall biosynthesis